jgi:hypothetical protein
LKSQADGSLAQKLKQSQRVGPHEAHPAKDAPELGSGDRVPLKRV